MWNWFEVSPEVQEKSRTLLEDLLRNQDTDVKTLVERLKVQETFALRFSLPDIESEIQKKLDETSTLMNCSVDVFMTEEQRSMIYGRHVHKTFGI